MGKRAIKKLGLALGGGGAKGAYHLGVFKALHEHGVADKIMAVSGASVGSLNATLFVQNDLPLSTYIWLCEIEKEILYFDEQQFKEGFNVFNHLLNLTLGKQEWRTLLDKSKQSAIFSRKGLTSIIDTYLQFDFLQKRGVNIYASCTKVDTKEVAYFNLTNLKSHEEIIKVLLASSAIPAVFGHEKIGDHLYMDGGVADNLPIKPLYDEGCDLIITAPLWKTDRVKTHLYPNCQFIELIPETDLGGIAGVFDFSPKNSRLLMNQAYTEHNDLIATLPYVFKLGNGKKMANL